MKHPSEFRRIVAYPGHNRISREVLPDWRLFDRNAELDKTV